MSIVCEPSNALVFHAPFRRAQTVALKLTNTEDVPVAFRLQSNPARAFAVKPFSAKLKAGQTKDIEVKLRALDTEPPRDAECPHKLKILYVVLTPELATRRAGRKFWQKIPSSAVREVRLECRYAFPQGTLAVARLRLWELAVGAAQRASLVWRATGAATCVGAQPHLVRGDERAGPDNAAAHGGERLQDDVLDIGGKPPGEGRGVDAQAGDARVEESAGDAKPPEHAILETIPEGSYLQGDHIVVFGGDVESSSEDEHLAEEPFEPEAANSGSIVFPKQALRTAEDGPAGYYDLASTAKRRELESSLSGSASRVRRRSKDPSMVDIDSIVVSPSSPRENMEGDSSESPVTPEIQGLRREVEDLRRMMQAMHADWMGPPPEYPLETDSEPAVQES
ncbi:VAMP-associated protein [Phanerochaete sordida]|uniref:VAMP-associated protein n=1 Tax=Phanerochaete sordida TaxID=48140 RepID=A0A9P3G4P5_9APHY|nr:VAMP-associated protein [Phanerochaete sordida]